MLSPLQLLAADPRPDGLSKHPHKPSHAATSWLAPWASTHAVSHPESPSDSVLPQCQPPSVFSSSRKPSLSPLPLSSARALAWQPLHRGSGHLCPGLASLLQQQHEAGAGWHGRHQLSARADSRQARPRLTQSLPRPPGYPPPKRLLSLLPGSGPGTEPQGQRPGSFCGQWCLPVPCKPLLRVPSGPVTNRTTPGTGLGASGAQKWSPGAFSALPAPGLPSKGSQPCLVSPIRTQHLAAAPWYGFQEGFYMVPHLLGTHLPSGLGPEYDAGKAPADPMPRTAGDPFKHLRAEC